jgi:hypothetical protein
MTDGQGRKRLAALRTASTLVLPVSARIVPSFALRENCVATFLLNLAGLWRILVAMTIVQSWFFHDFPFIMRLGVTLKRQIKR